MKIIKRALLPVIFLTLIISMIGAVNADFGRTYTAPYGTPKIDAIIDGVWDNAQWTYVDKPHQGTNKSNSTVQVKMLWDDNHIYFLAVIEDNSFNAEYDVFEVYLDQNNKKTTYFENDDSQTRFRLAGSIVTGVHKGPNAQTNAPFKVEKVDYNKYILEGALFYTIERPRVGDVMGLEFMYSDGILGQSDMYEAYRWNVDTASGEARPFSSTLNYGILIFADKNGNTQGSIVPGNIQTTAKVTQADTTTAANTTTVADTTTSADTTTATDTTKTPDTTSKVTTASKNKNKDTTAPSNNENTRDNSIDKALLIALIAAVAVGLTAIVMLSVVLIKLKKKSPKE